MFFYLCDFYVHEEIYPLDSVQKYNRVRLKFKMAACCKQIRDNCIKLIKEHYLKLSQSLNYRI